MADDRISTVSRTPGGLAGVSAGQSNAAAERSAHVTRGGDEEKPVVCYVCGGPFKGGASKAARVLIPGPGLIQACSEECTQNPKWSTSWVVNGHFVDG